MRNRWLRDAFAVGLPTPADAAHSNAEPCHVLTTRDSIDEDEAVRLLSDHGISEEKAKVRLQVRSSRFLLFR